MKQCYNYYSNRIKIFLSALYFFVVIVFLPNAGIAFQIEKNIADHPRLLFTEEDQLRIQNISSNDTLLGNLIEVVHTYADFALYEPVFEYKFDDGATNYNGGNPRLKAQRRAAMFRVFNLALTYRLTGDVRYAERAKADLLAGASFPDWHSYHFLNVGEITTLMAIGYDWLYNYLTEEERVSIREAIVEHGLKEGLKAYSGEHPESWWTTRTNNWNQVCNAGLTLGALAVAEHYPELSTQILINAVESIPNAMKGYIPDGAWFEGPTYWAYGTTYNAMLLSSLRTSLNDILKLDRVDGYNELGMSGEFHMGVIGPTNRYFNFGDSKLIHYFSPVMFWLAKEFDNPMYAWFERWVSGLDLSRMKEMKLMENDTLDRFLALLVVWYDDRGKELTSDDLGLIQQFRGDAAVGVIRSDWESPDAIYLGFKGGYNQSAHGHLDIGSFVLDANGVRWALDLKSESSTQPGYFDFGNKRWQYFRANNHGHNSLVFGDDIQNIYARAPIIEFENINEISYAVVDKSEAYEMNAEIIQRGYAVIDKRRVLIQDQIQNPFKDEIVRWGMITSADILLDDSKALLKQEGEELIVEILEPEDARFEILTTEPPDNPPGQRSGDENMLAINYFLSSGETEDLVILMTPVRGDEDELTPPSFRPITTVSTSIIAENEIPGKFQLKGNFPNPFNPSTNIQFDLPTSAEIQIEVYDMMGRRVLQTQSKNFTSGNDKNINLDMSSFASGVYFYRVKAHSSSNTMIKTGKMSLIK